MAETSRRSVAGIVRLFLVVLAAVLAVSWVRHRIPKHEKMALRSSAPPAEMLGPGDIRIYNVDSSLDVVLLGDKVSTGLSPKTVASVRAQMDTSRSSDSGFGRNIEELVKRTVANTIGTHVEYSLADVRDVRYDGQHLIFDWKSGNRHGLFGNVSVNGSRKDDVFRPEDAQRFIQAVHERKRQLGQM